MDRFVLAFLRALHSSSATLPFPPTVSRLPVDWYVNPLIQPVPIRYESNADERAKGMAPLMDVTSNLDQEKAEEAGDNNEAIDDGMKEKASSPFRRRMRACRLINPSQRRSSSVQSRWTDRSHSLTTMEPRRR